MNEDHSSKIIRETFLSRRPRAGSAWVALASVALPFLMSFLYWESNSAWAACLPAVANKLRVEHEYWRLFTSMSVHTDLGHLLGNSVALGVLSFLLYGYYGPLVHPVLTVLLGALVTGLALATYSLDTSLLGASGLVYLMAAFWLILYLLIERRYSVGKRSFRALGFGLVVLAPTTYRPEVSYRAHAIGFLVGLVAGITYFALNKSAIRQAEIIEIETDF